MSVSAPIDSAIKDLLRLHAGNSWFLTSFWPETEERVRMILADVQRYGPPESNRRVFDVGCFSGFLSFLLARLGYEVHATDSFSLPANDPILSQPGISYFASNLNHLQPFSKIPDGFFDVILLGEVIEHILNHPLGLMKELARVLRPSGILILTTPNPSTVMNALRLLQDRPLLWGTEEFIEKPKFTGDQFIDYEGIHYREYIKSDLEKMLASSGLVREKSLYIGSGASPHQPFYKRLFKRFFVTKKLMCLRCFGRTHYVVARKS